MNISLTGSRFTYKLVTYLLINVRQAGLSNLIFSFQAKSQLSQCLSSSMIICKLNILFQFGSLTSSRSTQKTLRNPHNDQEFQGQQRFIRHSQVLLSNGSALRCTLAGPQLCPWKFTVHVRYSQVRPISISKHNIKYNDNLNYQRSRLFQQFSLESKSQRIQWLIMKGYREKSSWSRAVMLCSWGRIDLLWTCITLIF